MLATPKGWTGPKVVDGLQVEGTFRAHQVPLAEVRENPAHLKLLDAWMRSYRPEELFDEHGRLRPELAALAPRGARRMGANPHTNGGALLRELRMPEFREYAVSVASPGSVRAEDTRVLGTFLRDSDQAESAAALLSPVRSGRNELQPSDGGIRGDKSAMAGADGGGR